MRHAGELLSRYQLLERAWTASTTTARIHQRVHSYLRDKIDRPSGTHAIETVRGVGYRLRADGGC